MSDSSYNQARKILSDEKSGSKEFFEAAQISATLLAETDTSGLGRDLAIRALDVWHNIPEVIRPVWNDLIEASGLYPYTKTDLLDTSSLLRQEFHRSEFLRDKYLHAEQMELSALLLHSDRSLIVSAPTSFGKSLLIEELVASKKYNNVVIIQPTLALLDETRKKLQKYINDYNIVVSTTQSFDPNKRNLFLFTGERVVEYPEFPPVDFFIVDEFYKLSMDRDDERATSLNEAVYRLLKLTKRFYMLGPNIKSIPEDFSDAYQAEWKKTDYATVAVDVERLYENLDQLQGVNYTHIALDKDKINSLDIDDHLKGQIFTGSLESDFFFREGSDKTIENLPSEYKKIKRKLQNLCKDAKEQGNLFALLITLKDPTLIYCSSPAKTFKVAGNFLSFLNSRGSNDLNLPASDGSIIEWIKENIDEKWILAKALKKSIGIHNGIVPRHLSSSIIDAFNEGKVQYLFCTSTLIEGVNTSAKNVVLLDRMKGPKPIDYFDFKNIAGRTGRMNRHFVGRVFQFHKEPKQMEIEVDIPLFTQNNATTELLVQMDPVDLKKESEKKLDKFKQLDPKVQDLLKKNKGVPIQGQLKVLEILEKDILSNHGLLSWKGIPREYNQLKYVVELGWSHLRQKGESNGGLRSAAQLATLTLQYCKHKSAQALIKMNYDSAYWVEKIPNADERLQYIINSTLQATQHWFNYKLPKILVVMSELQKYVCEKHGLEPGDYTVLAGMVENSFVPQHLAVLLEYGIPASAINKLSSVIKQELEPSLLIERIRSLDLESLGLLPYEITKIQNLIREYASNDF